MIKLKDRVYYLYIVLVLLYAGLTFLISPTATELQKYHVSLFRLRLIDVTVLIPYFFIWLAGFYGYAKLKAYSQGLKRAADGRQMDILARGLLFLVLWPALSSILASTFNPMSQKYMADKATFTIINEYFNLLWPLVGFYFLESGARGLSELAKSRPTHRATHFLALALIGFGVFYSYLATYAFKLSPQAYAVPYWAVLATLVVPYVYMWFLGLLAAYQISLYQRNVSGVVYRKSWRLLSLGIAAIVIMQIVVQYANAIITKLTNLPLSRYLATIYLVLVLLAVGYLLVAQGAKKLQKIEEV